MDFKELLIKLNACDLAKDWAGDKSIEDVVNTCHRGDWLLWLAKKIDIPLKPLTLAKGLCAETVIHLMQDERSVIAVKAAIAFGRGEINIVELGSAYAAADAAMWDACDAAWAAASAAAWAASDAARAVAWAAARAAASTAAAKTENQLKTADICREVLGKLIIDKVNELIK